MHGLILDTTPDIATPVQWAITLVAPPVTTLVAWVLTTALIERPVTKYGRSFAWSERPRRNAGARVAQPADV